ncbi:hypothetical protein MET9862_05698 [Methylobacterium symbioticum]|uniref:NAD-specific glutamate dehydrogenase n=1 Tax=Methylobacterium symbioticum TaxID=2584084 RepID=A0A509ELN2_9HYPH|nr:hypothetical protein MET9862_05698 [Methylobacterium symbioticum]
MRAGDRGGFEHARADALAAHLQEAEGRDPADLDAGAVVLQALVELLLDGAVVALLLHVDEVDHDQAGEIAQAELPGDLLGRLEIRLERGVLDVVLAGGAAGIDVDRDQRLGRVDDEVAARLQRDMGREHLVELLLNPVAGEDRRRVAVGLHHLRLAGHQHAHEVLGLAVGVLARDQHLLQVLVVEVADGALDQRALLVDQRRRHRGERQLTHRFPQAHQVLEVALDLGLGAHGAGRAQDDAHPLRHVEVGHHLLEALAVGRRGDLARDAAAPAGIGHQHRVAPGERQVGGQRRALGAALLLHHLHEDDLAALDHLLDLVVAARAARALGDLGQRVAVAADLGDATLGILAVLGLLAVLVVRILILVLVGLVVGILVLVLVRLLILGGLVRSGGLGDGQRLGDRDDGLGGRAGRGLAGDGRLGGRLDLRLGRLGGGRGLTGLALGGRGRRDLVTALGAGGGGIRQVGGGVATRDRHGLVGRRVHGDVFGLAVDDGRSGLLAHRGIGVARGGLGPAAAMAAGRAAALLALAVLLRVAGLVLQERLPVGQRDLVVVGVDLVEGEEAVAVAAVLHEGGLERGLHPRHLGEIDVAAQLTPVGGLEVELLDPRAVDRDDPGLLRVRRIDEHLVVGHDELSTWRPATPSRGDVPVERLPASRPVGDTLAPASSPRPRGLIGRGSRQPPLGTPQRRARG